jgi:hypothetical protein
MTDVLRREPRRRAADGTVLSTYPVVRCGCGREVHCPDGWANACDCGTEFNGSGQRLAPRAFWGEETGETFG